MGDELQAALRVDGAVWGFVCLHRSGTTGFSTAETSALAQIAPHAAEAIRRIVATTAQAPTGTQPQAVIIVADGIVSAVAGTVEDLAGDTISVGEPLPLSLASLAGRFEAIETDTTNSRQSPQPQSGSQPAAAHSARCTRNDSTTPTAPDPSCSPSHQPRPHSDHRSCSPPTDSHRPKRRVANLVLQGCTTRQIVVDLGIGAHTVQDHLKAIFDKTGVRSRRELASSLMQPSS